MLGYAWIDIQGVEWESGLKYPSVRRSSQSWIHSRRQNEAYG